jgi:hypothetical protein
MLHDPDAAWLPNDYGELNASGHLSLKKEKIVLYHSKILKLIKYHCKLLV